MAHKELVRKNGKEGGQSNCALICYVVSSKAPTNTLSGRFSATIVTIAVKVVAARGGQRSPSPLSNTNSGHQKHADEGSSSLARVDISCNSLARVTDTPPHQKCCCSL